MCASLLSIFTSKGKNTTLMGSFIYSLLINHPIKDSSALFKSKDSEMLSILSWKGTQNSFHGLNQNDQSWVSDDLTAFSQNSDTIYQFSAYL